MNLTEFKGYVGEWIACLLLILKGFDIISRRYKTKCGEIDIIAKKRDLLIFVEVKSRKSTEKCYTAVTSKQLKRVQNASMIFLKYNPQYTNFFTRYDVVLVAAWHFPIHIENVTQ